MSGRVTRVTREDRFVYVMQQSANGLGDTLLEYRDDLLDVLGTMEEYERRIIELKAKYKAIKNDIIATSKATISNETIQAYKELYNNVTYK